MKKEKNNDKIKVTYDKLTNREENVVAIFETMKTKISAAGQSTVQKAKDLTEITKLHSAISGAEEQIRELYTNLGYEIYRAYYEKPLPEVEDQIRQITELHQKIEDCKAQIDAINAVKTCPQCGAKVARDMAFCGTCGSKLPVEEAVPEVEAQRAFCDACGAPIAADTVFCTNCGNKVG